MIGVATAVSGDASTPYPLLYVCVVAFAFCLLNRAAALVHTMLVVAIYATTLSLFHGHNAEAALPRFAVFGVSLFAGTQSPKSLLRRFSQSRFGFSAWM